MIVTKEIQHPGMRLGKRAPRFDRRTLRVGDYMRGTTLPPPQAAVNWTNHVPAWGMMRNDELGDCAIVSPAHLIMLWTSCASKEFVPSDADVVKAYSAVSGYDPRTGNNDNGCVMLDVMNYWRKRGIAGHKLRAFAAVDHRNVNQVRLAVELFGGMNTGFALPLTCQSQDVWDVPPGGPRGHGAPGSWGGHAVPIVAYDPVSITCVTWGALKRMTWRFFATYCDECYAPLSKDWIGTGGRCPDGFDFASLQADLRAIAA